MRTGGSAIEKVQLKLHTHTEFTAKQALELLFRRRPGITAVICFTDNGATPATRLNEHREGLGF